MDDIYDNPKSGGVWLNGLNSLKNSNNHGDKTSAESPAGMQLPKPREGYEEGVKKLLAEENIPLDELSSGDDKEKTDSVKLIQSIYSDDNDLSNAGNMTPESMLTSHRGYQMKRLENIMLSYDKEIESITERLKQLTNQVK